MGDTVATGFQQQIVVVRLEYGRSPSESVLSSQHCAGIGSMLLGQVL
jgi:hypothetical protein